MGIALVDLLASSLPHHQAAPQKKKMALYRRQPGKQSAAASEHTRAEIDSSALESLQEGASFADFLERFFETFSEGDAAVRQVLEGRVAAAGAPLSYTRLGEQADHTGTWAKQKESEAQCKLQENISCLVPKWMDIPAFSACLQRSGGVAGYDGAMRSVLFCRLALTEKDYPAVKNFIKFTAFLFTESLAFDDGLMAVYDTAHPCVRCKRVLRNVYASFIFSGVEQWKSRALATHVYASCGACREREQIERFSESFLRRKSIKKISFKSGVFTYRQNKSQGSAKRRKLEQYVKEKNGAVSHQELQRSLAQIYPDAEIKLGTLRSMLSGSPALCCWGRGYYIHKDNIKVPRERIAKLEDAAVRMLNESKFALRAGDLFARHREECGECGVLDDVALYNCLRLSNDARLAYPAYPQICLKNNA